MLKVSVVVPVYNPGEYFGACIDSLTSQSLPADEFEVICVDDGSTDDTPARLDELAATYPHIRVIHQPNSGWPGQPRNVGLDAARGEYVFFCDHDDWLGTEALERLYEFASSCGSDIVLPKMAGLGRPVPRRVFDETVRECTLSDSTIINSLTPHKLFRREFLSEHRIRFAEGRRRLEDQLFVVTCYLMARVVSIYADYTCYFLIRRADSGNAGYRKINWHDYFNYLAEALDVVVAHTEPGEQRDRIFRRWLQVEIGNRLSGRRRLQMRDESAAELVANAHRIATRYFGEGVIALLEPLQQRVARAIFAGDPEEVHRIAEETAEWRAYPRVLQAGWNDGHLEVSGTVQLSDVTQPLGDARLRASSSKSDIVAELDPVEEAETLFTEMPDEPLAEKRFAALLGGIAPEVMWFGMATSNLHLELTKRETGENWLIPATIRRMGLAASFCAAIDPNTVAAGARLVDGLWDLHVHFGVLGLGERRRATLIEERQPGPLLPEPAEDGAPTVAVYFSRQISGLCLDVGLVNHPKLRTGSQAAIESRVAGAPPAPATRKPRKKTRFARRLVRKLRRMLPG